MLFLQQLVVFVILNYPTTYSIIVRLSSCDTNGIIPYLVHHKLKYR